MEINENLMYIKASISMIADVLKVFSLVIFIYYTNFKLINQKFTVNIPRAILMIFIAIAYVGIKKEVNYVIGIISLTISVSLIFSTKNIGKAVLTTIISLSINHILSITSSVICFFINMILRINNDYFNLFTITLIHIVMLYSVFKIRKLKQGISFLKVKKENDNLDVLALNVNMIVLFFITILADSNIVQSKNIIPGIFLFAVIMIITIQKSLQLYYKQKLLAQELENMKKELETKTKEVEDLEIENIAISKKAHTLDHKQKSLAKKIDEMMLNTEISKEEVSKVKERLNKIGKELYKEKTTTKLAKTEIPEIDDMLKYMQSECSANKIEFELQIKGNIHYMINNLIAKEDLETLLADHIKNAIIAINHTDNINRSILVRLGEIDRIYSLYIYDSGIEFTKDILENLGKKPSTTHADEGGTGMGFMNTFDTLRKCKASLIIEEIGKPTKDNYTKSIIIKFDNKNEFKIKSYR